jgi:hypothetical protein
MDRKKKKINSNGKVILKVKFLLPINCALNVSQLQRRSRNGPTPAGSLRGVRTAPTGRMNGRQARVKCSRSGRQPDPRPRSVGLAPPPSLLHDSPVPSMEGRGQCDPPSRHHHHPGPTRRASPRGTRVSSSLQTSLASPAAKPGSSGARRSNMRSPLSPPLGEVEAAPRVPPLRSRLTHPPAPRAHRLPAHRSTEAPREPGTRAPGPERQGQGRTEGEGKATPGLPPPSHSRPAHRLPSRRSWCPLRAGPTPLPVTKTIPTSPAPSHHHPPPRWTPLGSTGGATPPLPHPLPQPSGPHKNVCATRRRGQPPGHPRLPAKGQAQEEGEGAARGGVRARNACPRGARVRRETERGEPWGWGPQAILTGSTVAILDRSDRTTAPEGGVRGKK